jgi:hypothetical protein
LGDIEFKAKVDADEFSEYSVRITELLNIWMVLGVR